MIEIKSTDGSKGINFPTSIAEISAKDLDVATKHITVPKFYCLVALCFQTRLFDFVTMLNANNNSNIGVVPIIAKVNKEELVDYGLNKDNEDIICNKIIIDRSSLERGVHVNIPISISTNKVRKFFKDDKELVTNVIRNNKYKNVNVTDDIIIIEFKIIPISDIKGIIDRKSIVYDPYKL